MKVLHVIPSVSPMHGGPSLAVRGMTEVVAALGIDVDVATTTADGDAETDVPLDGPVVERGVRYFYFPRQRPKSWTFSWPLSRWLARYAGSYSVLHVHGLFSCPTLTACWAARRRHVPYVLRPLGALDPWALRVRRWKKVPYFRLLERRNLLHAAVVHAVSPREQRAIEALGLRVRVVTIPLGVDPPAANNRGDHRRREGAAPDSPTNVLFLSRLHPKKGIEFLLDAVALLVHEQPLRLWVAGEGDEAYVRSLKNHAARKGLGTRVTFTGFVAGADKARLFRQADLFVLPSYDENFGIAVAEALSAGLPVVVSDDVALAQHIREAGAGLVVPRDAGDLARAIRALVGDPDLCRRMGEAGRRLAQAEFSWPVVGDRLGALYGELVASRRVETAAPAGRARP